MEIKAKLNKPYTSKQRADFIVANNHNKGYEIKEVADGLEAWGMTQEEQELADLENKKNSVRRVRNSYLETYVDPKQLVMVWNSLTTEEQELYKDYRQYLLDYPQAEGWYEQNPDDWETWLLAHKPVTEENEDVTSVPVDNI